MVRKPLLIASIIVLFIASLGYLVYSNWETSVHKPLETQVTQVLATRTGFANATATQARIYAEITATAVQAVQYIQQTNTQISSYITATARPTITPTPGQSCQAQVNNEYAYLYADPGVNPNPESRTKVPLKQEVQIVGRIDDPEWLFIDWVGVRGFMQSVNLKRENYECEPQLFDLHYMAGYLDDPDWRLMLEDSFASNSYIWYTGDNEQLTTDASNSEAQLELTSYNYQQEVWTEKLANKQFNAFEVIFNADVERANIDGYLGLKFFISDEGFHEIRFNPYSCIYSVHDGESEVFNGKVDLSLCRGETIFQVRFKIDEAKNLLVTINGETQGPTKLPSLEAKSGPIRLTVSDLKVAYNYLVVTAPKE